MVRTWWFFWYIPSSSSMRITWPPPIFLIKEITNWVGVWAAPLCVMCICVTSYYYFQASCLSICNDGAYYGRRTLLVLFGDIETCRVLQSSCILAIKIHVLTSSMLLALLIWDRLVLCSVVVVGQQLFLLLSRIRSQESSRIRSWLNT